MRARNLSHISGLREAVASVVAQMNEPLTREQIVHQVLRLYSSEAKRPSDQIIAEIRRHTDLIRLDDGKFAPPDWILRNVRFRYIPSANEAMNGIVPIFPCFVPFLLESDLPYSAKEANQQRPVLLENQSGKEISWDTIHLDRSDLVHDSGDNAIYFQALNLRPWFRENCFAVGDSILFKIDDPKLGVFRMEHEAAADADRAAIAIQDATLEAEMLLLVAKNSSEQPFIEEIIPAALGRLHDAACRYPGNHWYTITMNSPRLRPVDDYGIARSTFRRPIDRLFGYTGSPASEKELRNRIDLYNAEQIRVLQTLIGEGLVRSEVTPDGSTGALQASKQQIARHLRNEGSGSPSDDLYRSLALPSVYLAKHEGLSLADADFEKLSRFLLSYYPRRALFNRKSFTGRMLGALRRFYEAQPSAAAAYLATRLPQLQGLIDRKISLLHEIDLASPDSASLFSRLFPNADKDDAEVVTLEL